MKLKFFKVNVKNTWATSFGVVHTKRTVKFKFALINILKAPKIQTELIANKVPSRQLHVQS